MLELCVKIFELLVSKPIINAYYKINLFRNKKIEEKRIETLINWKKKTEYEKEDFATDRVKVKDVSPDKNEEAFIEASKKSLITVMVNLKENKSENLVKAVSQWIILDYLGQIKKYISPELGNAINNVETVRMLREMRDYEAERMFISTQVVSAKIQELMTILQILNVENLNGNLLKPYLIRLEKVETKYVVNFTEIKQDCERLLIWLADYNKRLSTPFVSKYFLKTEFLYVRLPDTPLIAHIERAIEKFENHKCDVIVVSGWEKDKNDILWVSRNLVKNYNYPSVKEFNGQRAHLDSTMEKRFNILHKKPSTEFNIPKKGFFDGISSLLSK